MTELERRLTELQHQHLLFVSPGDDIISIDMMRGETMVDFAELRRRHYESLDDAGRARIDAYWEREAEADKTAEDIDAVFETLEARSGRVTKTETRSIRVRIERKEGTDAELVSFKGAVTGYETYALDADFVRAVQEAADQADGRFCICAGTAGRYDACSVSSHDLQVYLQRQRPDLVQMISSSPSV